MVKINIMFGSQGCALAEELLNVAVLEGSDELSNDDVKDFTLDDLDEVNPNIREFDTQAEADAYIMGIADMDGWMQWSLLDDNEVSALEKAKEIVLRHKSKTYVYVSARDYCEQNGITEDDMGIEQPCDVSEVCDIAEEHLKMIGVDWKKC